MRAQLKCSTNKKKTLFKDNYQDRTTSPISSTYNATLQTQHEQQTDGNTKHNKISRQAQTQHTTKAKQTHHKESTSNKQNREQNTSKGKQTTNSISNTHTHTHDTHSKS